MSKGWRVRSLVPALLAAAGCATGGARPAAPAPRPLPPLAGTWEGILDVDATTRARAVLHLAYVPDPEIHGQRLDKLFLRSPLQRFQLDLFQVWVPILELCLIVAVIAFSLPQKGDKGDNDD